jgi:DNA-binding IclR family transcriptional regulator
MPKKPRQDVSAVESPAPAVERAVQLLRLMGERPGGLSTQDLAEVTKTPRATLYRILAVLTSHGFVQEAEDGPARYQLGPAVAKLGRQAPQPRNFVALARPLMEHLAQTVRETVKLVVIDGVDALTVAVEDTGLDARVTSRVGTRMPLYVGASQRLLLAHADADLQQRVLSQPLQARTSRTFTDPRRLMASLHRLRLGNSSQTHSEGIDGVGAAAAVVRGARDTVLGAIAVVYIQRSKTAADLKTILEAVEATAREISAWQLDPTPVR